MLQKITQYILKHKILSFIILIAVVWGGYVIVKNISGGSTKPKYVFAQVKKDILISTVSGSGQVSASDSLDLKAKYAGDLVLLQALAGQEVKKGQLLAKIDDTDAQKSVRDARLSYDSAQLAMEKLQKPADELSLMQAENSVSQAKENLQKAQNDLDSAYDDGFNTVSSAFIDMPTIVNALHDILLSNSYNVGGFDVDYYYSIIKSYDSTSKPKDYWYSAYHSYEQSKSSYDSNFQIFKSVNVFSSKEEKENLVKKTYQGAQNVADAVKATNNLLQLYKDTLTNNGLALPSLVNTHLTNLNSYTTKINNHVSNLLSAQQTIDNAKVSLENAKRSLSEKEQSLKDLKAGADALDVKTQQISLDQRQNALLDAQEKLNDYYLRAPFDGVIAKVSAELGDSLSANTAVATIITKNRIAEISLNEVDAAKVKQGQKATLTFDAVSDLSIAGEVLEIDAMGTVSQGVVSYNAKIGFDTQDERIKPGMTVSAKIITQSKADVLLVPTTAVKSSGNTSYVEMADENINTQKATAATGIELTKPTKQQVVEIGSSSDSYVEIVSGLKEGDLVISKTVSKSSTTQAQRTQNLFGGAGGARMMIGR